MSKYVQFEPTGLWIYRYDSDTKEYVRWKRPGRHSVLTHLRRECQIQEGTTLQDIFRAVARYKLLTAFISMYSWCPDIEEFHAVVRHFGLWNNRAKQMAEQMSLFDDIGTVRLVGSKAAAKA